MRAAGSGEGRSIVIGGVRFAKGILPPGWRWSNDVKPITKTDSCQAHHVGYVVSGRIHVVLDGADEEFGPGDLYVIPPGHDAWVVGNETLINLEVVTGEDNWAKPAA